MSERIVKFRLITWFDEVDSLTQPGTTALQERIGHFGETVNISREVDEKRLDSLGALYTAEEQKAIEDGSYRGPDAALLANAQAGVKAASLVEDLDDEGPQIDAMSTEELGEYIAANKLTVPQTVQLAGDTPDEDKINKVLDAENIATDNEPRVGVVDALEKKLAAATGAK